jgi:hypothetical protein
LFLIERLRLYPHIATTAMVELDFDLCSFILEGPSAPNPDLPPYGAGRLIVVRNRRVLLLSEGQSRKQSRCKNERADLSSNVHEPPFSAKREDLNSSRYSLFLDGQTNPFNRLRVDSIGRKGR